ncbi:THO complex subunit 4B-like isoform X2 [Vigna radiata var. radiata]|uniref:THO complex subunit 4B-like isoform X2 n=1 Tax=Vigna radiata var. radiata TaxID=3916 RepID=A0A1S3TT53_VIGRR|nr:THO complex subunit 4B-like isoform X2 [Vigna radiata var. radiata]
MVAGIDMSLDDIMRHSAKVAASRRRYSFVRNPVRTTPYPVQLARYHGGMIPEMVFEDDGAAMIERGTKLLISNLDLGVSNGDIKLLFSEEGELKRCSIHYDQNGRSKGTAEVVFMRHSDALSAIKKYNNMRLDGKPLQIELVGTSSPVVASLRQNSLLGRPSDSLLSKGERVGGRGFHNDFVQGYIPRVRGEEKGYNRELYLTDVDDALERPHRVPRYHAKVKSNNRKVTAKDLDDDLERYHLEAKRIKEQNGKSDNH